MSSYWIESTKDLFRENKIDKDYIADVCIIGAGITGLTTAYYLSRQGLKVIIVDKNLIGQKVSGNTTAKITFQHSLIYNYLINEFDEEFARKYFESNNEAIGEIKRIINTENIDCDFEYQPNYIYTKEQSEVQKIQKEVDAINLLSKQKDFAKFVNESELPFEIKGAIKTDNQAQFNPSKYMHGLAKAIENNGVQIFTNFCIQDIKRDTDGYVSITDNYKIKSKHLVLASHYPFIKFPGFYFLKMYQVTSFAMAIQTNSKLCNGMYITSSEPTLSFRTAKNGDKRLLIVAGGNHKTGFAPESENIFGYNYLENEIKKLYKDYKILYKWNTRDCISLDKVPYIGQFSSMYPNMYIATGFNKWGMTTSNVAANIISDSILDNENGYKDVYNSKRLKPIKNKEELKNMTKQAVKSFVTNRIKIPKESLGAIKKDNGGILKIDGISVGIYKDANGKIYAVNPTCTHLGCLLTWNNLDKTWDCPCHGSLFDYTGKNIYDPAFENLEIYESE